MTLDLAAAIANDHEVFDNLQTVTLLQDGVSTSVAEVAKSMLSRKQIEMVSGIVGLEGTERSFSLPVANLSGVSPRQGSKITDAGGTAWTIIAVDHATVDTRYRCVCQKQK